MIIRQTNDTKICILALSCLFEISRLLGERMSQEIKNSDVLTHLARKGNSIDQEIYHKKLIKTIEIHFKVLDQEKFRCILLPYFT